MSSAIGPPIEGLTFVQHLGSGGYSDVYLYERQRPRMRVAVKVLSGELLSDAELAQFAAEAETMAELADHPYIVQVFWTGTTTDGRPYLVMKYYPPPNLGKRAESQRFAVPEVLRTGIQIGSAVETAHRAGILHRDIKPANILISQYNEPGLTDFGIAGHALDPNDEQDLGVSIPWSPPEVLSGASNGSAQSDVYSLAATIWHLLAGRSPFEVRGGDNSPRALMGRVLRTAVPATGRADVPPSLERLLQQAMAKTPELRPRTALEFVRGLQGVEQELRLARTVIVVDDPAAASARPDDYNTSPEATRMRASRPMPVTDEPGARSMPLAPIAPAPAGLIDSVPSSDGIPSRVIPHEPVAAPEPTPATEWSPPTSLRPARPTGAGPARPSGQTDLTTSRGSRPASAVDEVEPVAEPRRVGRFRASHVAIGAAAVVIVAVVVAVVASGGKSGTGGTAGPPATNPATGVHGLGHPGSVTPLQAPILTATPDLVNHTITYRWSAPPGSVTPLNGSSQWVYQYSSPQNQNPPPVATNQNSYGPVHVTDPSQVCFRVGVPDGTGKTVWSQWVGGCAADSN